MRFRLRLYLAGVSLLLLSGQPAALGGQKQTQFDDTAERELVRLINQSRAEQGLPAMIVDQRLTEAARKHTLRMVQHRELKHQYSDEQPLQIRYSDENLRSDKQGENIALDLDPASAHKALMHSPGHRANILNPDYNAVGVGIVGTGHELYITEDFAQRMPDYSEHQADAALQRIIQRYAVQHKVLAPARRPLPRLRDMACKMALNDSLNNSAAQDVPGVHSAVEWTASDLDKLPPNAQELLSQPQSGYSFGLCFAPSVSHPGGVYWVVMVFY